MSGLGCLISSVRPSPDIFWWEYLLTESPPPPGQSSSCVTESGGFPTSGSSRRPTRAAPSSGRSGPTRWARSPTSSPSSAPPSTSTSTSSNTGGGRSVAGHAGHHPGLIVWLSVTMWVLLGITRLLNWLLFSWTLTQHQDTCRTTGA